MSNILSRTGTSGTTSVLATSSNPITKIGVTSGATTTFTATTVVDSVAWDLSAPVAGHFAKTSDGWIGLINTVNDGTDTLTVNKWVRADGASSDGKPVAGSTVTVHRVWRCNKLKVKADNSNAAGIHLRQNAAATASAYELLANETITFIPEAGCKYVDATLINAISSSGTITLWFASDCE